MRCEHCLQNNIDYFETEIVEEKGYEINKYHCDNCDLITEEKVKS